MGEMKTVAISIRKYTNIVLIISILIIAMMNTGCMTKEEKAKQQVMLEAMKIRMETYLEETYNRDFEVEFPTVTWNAGFGTGIYAIATTMDRGEEVSFAVGVLVNKEYEFEEGFLPTLWSVQATPDMTEIVQEVYDKNFYMGDLYYCRIRREGEGYSYAESVEIFEPYREKDYEDIVRLVDEGLEQVRVECEYYRFVEEGFDEEEEAKKAYEVFKALQETYKPESLPFFVRYLNVEYEDEAEDLINQVENADSSRGEKLAEDGKWFGSIIIMSEYEEINSAEDMLEEYIERKVE